MTKKSTRLPWVTYDTDTETAIYMLLRELNERHSKSETQLAAITPKEKSMLERRFNHAAMGRSPVRRYMEAIAKEIGIQDYKSAVKIASMKPWDRAVDKLHTRTRKLNDLGRGAIPVETPEQANTVCRILGRIAREGGYVPKLPDTASIIPNTFDNYLKDPRKSGYSGSINFDLNVDLGKSRVGTFEIQIRPKSELYEIAYDWSHQLFDMIRIIHETPNTFVTPSMRKLQDILILANTSIYDEQAVRTGFDILRREPVHFVTQEEFIQSIDILDRIRTEIENKYSHTEWASQTMEALSYAKTSVSNMFAAGARLQPRHDGQRKPAI